MRLYNADAELRENVFIDNYGDITSVVEGGGSMESCTIVNASGYYSSRPISMSGSIVRCIIVVTTPYAEAIFAGTPTVSCTDIYAPPATIDPGSYVDGGGNIAVDPLFCDAAGGDYHLFSASPCLYQPCGPMGAFGRGCWSEQPAVAGVTDVGNDQGRQARIAWARSLYDAGADSVVITGYGIYRRQDAYAAGKTELPPETLERREAGTSIAGWDYIATVPARGDSVYQTVVPTLCDSTIAGGMCWSVFFVSAMTPDPLVFFDSAPDSGYSLDNLPPSVPQNLVVAYNTGSGNKLEWHPNGDADLLCYRVYRSTDPNFTPEPGSHVHVAWTPVWVDSVSEGYQYHYAVTAVDVAGNESDAATPGSVTAAPREPTVPVRWALYDAVPNPFNPETTIRYDVPSGSGMVTLRIYDVRGALVRTLVDGRRPEGTHAIGWNGRDGRGRRVASGVYFCRMVSGRFAATRRVVLLK